MQSPFGKKTGERVASQVGGEIAYKRVEGTGYDSFSIRSPTTILLGVLWNGRGVVFTQLDIWGSDTIVYLSWIARLGVGLTRYIPTSP